MWAVANKCGPKNAGNPTKIKKNIDLDAFCVELRPFYWSKRILVPMSYITFFENLAVLVPYMSYIVYFHKLSNYMGKR